MKRSLLGIVLISAALVLGGCGGAVSDEYVIETQPYKLEPVEGQEVLRVILTESAAKHLGIETVAVRRVGPELVVPYEAVFIDAHGGFWVYTNPEPFEFVRAPIDIVRESSTQAFLAEGPPEGTQIVTVGVPELYGSENEFGT
jgi:hypothetical protein